MKRHLIAVGVVLIALAAWVGTASAANDPPPPGADQMLGQLAAALQGGPGGSVGGKTASNTSLPIGVTGSGISIGSGSGSANQTATNTADSDASNKSNTNQSATATQTGGSSSCLSGCGGAGQSQNIDHSALTNPPPHSHPN